MAEGRFRLPNLAGIFAAVVLATGAASLVFVVGASAQSAPSTSTAGGPTTTMIIETTVPQTTVPSAGTTPPADVEGVAIGPLCHVFTPQPASGDPVISQVILTSTGEVVATRTGDGPYVPEGFDTRCVSAPPPASAIPGKTSYTG